MIHTVDTLYDRTKQILQAARNEYGPFKELSVAAEELNELAGILMKLFRYDSMENAVEALRDKILTECADTFNALDHIQAVFNISDDEIIQEAAKKADRMAVWLINKNPLAASIKDRTIPKTPCGTCEYQSESWMFKECIDCVRSGNEFKNYSLKVQ